MGVLAHEPLLVLMPLLLSSIMIGLCRSMARLPGLKVEKVEEDDEDGSSTSMLGEEIIDVDSCEVQDDMFMFSPFIIILGNQCYMHGERGDVLGGGNVGKKEF